MYPAGIYHVATGVTSRRNVPSAHLSGVARTIVYPHFNTTFALGDAGLLILKEPTDAKPLALADKADTHLLAPRAPVDLAGWGFTDLRAADAPALLHATGLQVLPNSRCGTPKTDPTHHFDRTKQLCASDTARKRTSGCFGDSGGAVVAPRSDGSPVEVGIVSNGGPECEPNQPNIFTRVSSIHGWVERWIAAIETGAPEPADPPLAPPYMSTLEGQYLAELALGQKFGAHKPEFHHTIELRCAFSGHSTSRCHATWQLGDREFFGFITVFYLPHHDTLLWSDRYKIHSASISCRSSGKAGCPVQTLTGHDRIHELGRAG
jgi:hypothetical protein